MLLIFIAALTGCDDNVNDHFALPQTNPQEPVQNVEGFTLSLGSSCTAPILFKDLDDATLLEVAKLTDHPELTEGDTINLEVEVSKDETFTQAVPLPCSVKNGTASVTAGELEEVVKEIYGKAPHARTIYARATIYIVSHTSAIALPEKITLGKIEATPEALFIDTAYYLIGDVNKWNSEALIKFGHSGKDVYEDPVFSMIVEMPKDECYWKIIPQSNVDGGDIWAPGALGVATNGDDSESGLLVTENPQAGKAAAAVVPVVRKTRKPEKSLPKDG